MTKTKNKKIPVFGVIVSGVTKEDAIERYLDAINGNSVSLYTSKASNLGILSEAGTHLYNPVTANADMEESDEEVDTMLSSYSSSESDEADAHYMLCSDGCGAHIIASDNFISQFCPVCASELSDPEGEEEVVDDLDNFDTSFEEESKCESGEISDEEIDDFAAIAGVDFGDDDEASESMSDEEIMHYSALAGVSISEDEEDSDLEYSEDDTDLEYVDDEASEEEMEPEEDSEVESDEEDAAEEAVEEEPSDVSNSDIVTTGPAKEDAITAFAEACISGSVTKYKSSLSGHVFYSASSDLNYDPIMGDPNLEAQEVIISTSSYADSDTVDAHYMMCSSAECGTHIVSSNDKIEFCPVCAADVMEPESDAELVEEPSDVSEDDESEFSLEVIPEDEAEVEAAGCKNEKALSQMLSFVSGGNEVSTSKLSVAYCGNINGENSWLAFYNGQPIAKATASSAEKHKAIFEEPAYANAIIAGAEHLGISKILDEMGFQASMSSVAISEQLEKNILNRRFKDKLQAMSAQLENELMQKTSDYRERFIAAMSTAAVGINRGFFKGYVNPVKQTLQNSLSAAGVRQPEIMLDNVFRSHSDDYNKMLIEKTLEILEKPVEVQNEIAIAVSESNYMGASTASNDTAVEDRLTTLGKEVRTVSQSSSNVTSFDSSKMKNVVASLGKRF